MLKQKIKTALELRGLSIRRLCLTLDLRQASVSEFLSGKRQNIGIQKLERILIHLDLMK